MPVLTVSQLNRYVASVLHGDAHLRTVFLRGELSNFSRNTNSGHCYFSVRDASAVIKGVMFRSCFERLRFTPQNGMDVIVQGEVKLYERDGSYQISAVDMQPFGIGQQEIALRELTERLERQGYFAQERKRPIPAMPRKIGIVTSPDAAALTDFLTVLERRFPLCTVCKYYAQVQGVSAPDSIARALQIAGQDGCDVILMGRGGGSREELAAFQTEAVANAVFRSPVPVISAVGHERDNCIADLVADLRASTPTAAAELAVPDIRVLREGVLAQQSRLKTAFSAICREKQAALEKMQLRLERYSPAGSVKLHIGQLRTLETRLSAAMQRTLAQAEKQLAVSAGKLEAYSPVAVLSRGYAIAYRGERILRSADDAAPGDLLTVRLAHGTVTVEVRACEPETT